MRQFDPLPDDSETVAELDAIDATLAGEAVAPRYAELAELALILASEREAPTGRFARELDARAARRFEPERPTADASRYWRPGRLRRGSGPRGLALHLRRSRALVGAVVGALATVAAAAVIASGAFPRGAPQSFAPHGASTAAGAGRAATTLPGPAPVRAAPTLLGPAPVRAAPTLPGPAPVPGSAPHQIQSAQLELSTPGAHIDQLAQEVFNVVSLVDGRVQSSTVTQAGAGVDGGSYASFTLQIPTGSLQLALTRLSALRYATVSSRTDGTQNVGDRYAADQRRIADAQALRTSLLHQLETADTEPAIDSIKAQLKLLERQLTGDQTTFQTLRHRIAFSTLAVQVNAAPVVLARASARPAGSGFTLGRAAHDAGRVLVVAAGVALIALALALPLGLLGVLIGWGVYRVRRRRREHALDAH